MRWNGVLFVSIAVSLLAGCGPSFSAHQAELPWTTGFWFWQGTSFDGRWSGAPLAVLFVQAGTISHQSGRWRVSGSLPPALPPAREYWLVFRYERQGVPDSTVAPMLARTTGDLQAAAASRHLNVAGVQLDIDSPTNALTDYAAFLHELRGKLPEGCAISITALLDWFRSGTAVARLIRETDEFVPQFYDIEAPRMDGGQMAVAAPIDAARWGLVFNGFGKRFRIGISSFGRARRVPGRTFFGDAAPIDIATNPAFELTAERSRTQELVLNYRAVRPAGIGRNDFAAGDTIQFVLPTAEGVRTAVENARRIKGHNAGVVFFRWPSPNEALAMAPIDVLAAAGLEARRQPPETHVEAQNGHCIESRCVDVFVTLADPLSSKALRYKIHSSGQLRYFVPEENMPVRMKDSSTLVLSLPPYCGRERLYLGRAVMLRPAVFTLEAE